MGVHRLEGGSVEVVALLLHSFCFFSCGATGFRTGLLFSQRGDFSFHVSLSWVFLASLWLVVVLFSLISLAKCSYSLVVGC